VSHLSVCKMSKYTNCRMIRFAYWAKPGTVIESSDSKLKVATSFKKIRTSEIRKELNMGQSEYKLQR
jgi:hypothetical protein